MNNLSIADANLKIEEQWRVLENKRGPVKTDWIGYENIVREICGSTEIDAPTKVFLIIEATAAFTGRGR